MKNLTKKIAGIMLMAFALISVPQEIFANSETNDVIVIVKEDLLGGWEYSVAGAPEGYNKGFMLIVKHGDAYKVQVQLNGGAVNGENVVVKGSKINFIVTVEGEKVTVALEAKGSKLTGTSVSPSNGTMNITGVKSLSAE
jgi:hypothetical protein